MEGWTLVECPDLVVHREVPRLTDDRPEATRPWVVAHRNLGRDLEARRIAHLELDEVLGAVAEASALVEVDWSRLEVDETVDGYPHAFPFEVVEQARAFRRLLNDRLVYLSKEQP